VSSQPLAASNPLPSHTLKLSPGTSQIFESTIAVCTPVPDVS
jgi:hypothetical protein